MKNGIRRYIVVLALVLVGMFGGVGSVWGDVYNTNRNWGYDSNQKTWYILFQSNSTLGTNTKNSTTQSWNVWLPNISGGTTAKWKAKGGGKNNTVTYDISGGGVSGTTSINCSNNNWTGDQTCTFSGTGNQTITMTSSTSQNKVTRYGYISIPVPEHIFLQDASGNPTTSRTVDFSDYVVVDEVSSEVTVKLYSFFSKSGNFACTPSNTTDFTVTATNDMPLKNYCGMKPGVGSSPGDAKGKLTNPEYYTIKIKFNPKSAGENKSCTITITDGSSHTATITVTGKAYYTYNFNSVTMGQASSEKSYTLSSLGLTTGNNQKYSINAVEGYLFRNGTSGTWQTSLSNVSAANNSSLYIKFQPNNSTNSYNDKYIEIKQNNQTKSKVKVSGSRQTETIAFDGITKVGQKSTAKAFNMTNLTAFADLTVSAPMDFEVSSDGTNFDQSCTIRQGDATGGIIYVRFAPQTKGAKSETVTITDGGTTPNKVYEFTVTGTAYDDPDNFRWTTDFNSIKNYNSSCGDNTITLQAKADNYNGTIDYSLDNSITSDIATISGNTLTIKKGGVDIIVKATITTTEGAKEYVYGATITNTFRADAEYFWMKDEDGSQNNNISLSFGTTDVGQPVTKRIYVHSFNLKNRTLAVVETENNKTKTGFEDNFGYSTVFPTAGCGESGVSDPGTYYIDITFHPYGSGTKSGTYTITAGNGTVATINVSGGATSMSFPSTCVGTEGSKLKVIKYPWPAGFAAGGRVSTNNSHLQVYCEYNKDWRNVGYVWGDSVSFRFNPTAVTSMGNNIKFNYSSDAGNAAGIYTVWYSGSSQKFNTSLEWDVPTSDLTMNSGDMYRLDGSHYAVCPCDGETILIKDITYNFTAGVFDTIRNGSELYLKAIGTPGSSSTVTATTPVLSSDKYDPSAAQSIQYTFTIANEQYIEWTDGTSLTIPATGADVSTAMGAVAKDASNDQTITGATITYDCEDDNVEITGSTAKFNAPGTYTLSATSTASGYPTTVGYRTFVVRKEGESCSQYSLTPQHIARGNNITFTLAGLPDKMSGSYDYGVGTTRAVHIEDQDAAQVWSVSSGMASEEGSETFSNIDMTGKSSIKVVSDNGEGFSRKHKITNLQISQHTYFRKESSSESSISFGDCTVGSEISRTFTIEYSNIPEESVTVTGDNPSDFIIDNRTVNGGSQVDCDCHGTITYTIKFKPTTAGAKSATVTFKTHIGGSESTIQLSVSGTATIIPTAVKFKQNAYVQDASFTTGWSFLTNAGTKSPTFGKGKNIYAVKSGTTTDIEDLNYGNGSYTLAQGNVGTSANISISSDNKFTIVGAYEDDADYADVNIKATFNGIDNYVGSNAIYIPIRIVKQDAPTIVWSPSPTEVAKGDVQTFSAPTTSTTSYTTTTYSAHSNITIEDNVATFTQAGLYEIQASMGKSKTHKNGSTVAHFKVNFGGFGNVALGGYSSEQAFVLSDASFTGTQDITVPTDFEIKAENGTWGSSIQNVNLASQPLKFYVRFAPKTGIATGGSMTKSGTITIGSQSFTVSGTMKWPVIAAFDETYIGQASASKSFDISGTFATITVPNGFMVSVDNTTWSHGLTNATISSKLYVKYQPNDAADGSSILLTYANGKHIEIAVSGTKKQYTITTASTYIGLARDVSWALTNFTVVTSATASIPASKDYYLSTSGGRTPSNWKKSNVTISSGSTLYVKFQPSDTEADRTGDITIVADGKNYTISAAGTAATISGNIDQVDVGKSSHYGSPKKGWWYFRKDDVLDATFIINTSNTSVTLSGSDTDFSLNNYDGSDTTRTLNITNYNDYFRVAYSPRQAISSTSCTVVLSANGKTYTYTVSSSAKEVPMNFGSIDVGKSSGYKPYSLQYFRPSYGANEGFYIKTPSNYLVSKNQTTWTDSLVFGNSKGKDDVFYVKFVPRVAGNCDTVMFIHDKGASARGDYKINLTGTGDESRKTLNATLSEVSEAKGFVMDNFTPDSTIVVVAPDSFKVSLDSADWNQYVTILKASTTKKFYVRMEPRSVSGTYTDTVWMTDSKTDRRYPLIVDGVVAKTEVTLSVAQDPLTYNSNDRTVHTIAGGQVYASNPIADEYIELSSSDNSKVEIVDGNKIRVVSGITSDCSVTITASIRDNDKVACSTPVSFTVNVKYVNITPESSLVWKYNTGNSKWYIYTGSYAVHDFAYKNQDASVSATVYLPNDSSSSMISASSSSGSNSITFYVNFDGGANEFSQEVSAEGSINNQSFTTPGKSNTASLVYGWTSSNWRGKSITISIPVPQHYDSLNNGAKTFIFESTEVGEVSYVDVPLTEMFKSFLTSSNGLKVEAKSDNPSGIFFFDNANLVPGNQVISPYNELSGASSGLIKDANNCYYLRLYFKPTSTADYTGIFYLKDGTNTKFTITVTGKGKVTIPEPQTIIWGQDFTRLLTGGANMPLTATSSSGLPIEYSITGSAASLSTDKKNLVINSAGTAKITATCIGDTINGIIYSTASEEKDIIVHSGSLPTPSECPSFFLAETEWKGQYDCSGYSNCNLVVHYDQDEDPDVTVPAIVYTGTDIATQLKFSLNSDAKTTSCTFNLYYQIGTGSITSLGSTISSVGNYTIPLTGLNIGVGTKFYCSFSSNNASGGVRTFSVTNFAIYGGSGSWTASTTPVDFGSQRIGQSGVTKKIIAADFSALGGDVVATIEGTDADCFYINGSNVINAGCDAGVAAFDVRFAPNKIVNANTIDARLVVTGPSNQTASIKLTGTSFQRDIKVKWEYANEARSVCAAGLTDSTSLDLKATDNAFAYDKLRGEYAKTTCKMNYTVVDHDTVMINNPPEQKIIDIVYDKDGLIDSIRATGYGSGTVYVIASPIVTGNTLFKEIEDADKDTLVITVKKIEAELEMITATPADEQRYYGDLDTIKSVTARLKGTDIELKDYNGKAIYKYKGGITLTASNCSIPTKATRDSLICFNTVSTDSKTVKVTATLSVDAVIKTMATKVLTFSVAKSSQKIGFLKSVTTNTYGNFSTSKSARTDGYGDYKLRSYYFSYDTRHSKLTGCEGKPTYLTSKGDTVLSTVSLVRTDFDSLITAAECSDSTIAYFRRDKTAPYFRYISRTKGSMYVYIPSGRCGNDEYSQTTDNSPKFILTIGKTDPDIKLIVDGDTAQTSDKKAATSTKQVTVDVTYGDIVTLGAYSYKLSSGVAYYRSTRDKQAEFSYTIADGNVGALVNLNNFGAIGFGTTQLTVTQTVNCKIKQSATNPNPNYFINVVKASRIVYWGDKCHQDTTILTNSDGITLGAYTKFTNNKETTFNIAKDDEGDLTYEILDNVDGYDGNDYVTISNGVMTIKQIDNSKLPLPASGVPITIRASFLNATNFEDATGEWTFTLKPQDIMWQNVPTTDNDHRLSLVGLTSTTENYDLITALKNYSEDKPITTNYPDDNVTYTFTISNTSFANVGADYKLTAYKRTHSTADFYIKIKATENITGTYDEKTFYINIPRGILYFQTAGNWTDPSNWSRSDIVTNKFKSQLGALNDYDVTIQKDCYIGKAAVTITSDADFLLQRVDAQCHDLRIDGADAKLTLSEAAALYVDGKLYNSNAAKLLLKANYWGQSTVKFDGAPSSGNPFATVEMYMLPGSGNANDPLWQYRGIIVDEGTFAKGNGPWNCLSIYEWDERYNGSTTDQGCWRNHQSGGDDGLSLSPWKGYAFANLCTVNDVAEEQWFTYTGRLINASHEFNLTKTDSDNGVDYDNKGINLMTNSYSAPMPIDSIDFRTNNAEVKLYNAGTYADWKNHHADEIDDYTHGDPGQMSSCPKNISGPVQNITAIPSGQAFFVTANANNSKVKFTYSKIKLNPSGRLFEPGREYTNSPYNILTINVAKKDSRDRVILVECDSCTRQYDNGYDGLKMKGDEGLPQIYAYNKFGKTAVNADSSFNKQYIGFVAGNDNDTYTITFNTDRLYGYHALFLTDRKLNETVDILAGESYQFKGYTVGEDMRFQINGITDEEWENRDDDDDDDDDKGECDLRVVGNVLYVEGFTTLGYDAQAVEVYDMAGNKVWSTAFTSERIYDLPVLPRGVYMIRVGDCWVKWMAD